MAESTPSALSAAAFYEVVPGSYIEFGIGADPNVNSAWASEGGLVQQRLRSNVRGTLAFVNGGGPVVTRLVVNL
jgi:hypothetical protein